jgi:hypothetical protein
MFVLDRVSPESAVFHRQFLFSVQLLVIVWLVLSLLLLIFKAGNSWVARFLPVMIVMIVLAVDILFTYWMEQPAKVPGFLKNQFKYYYAAFERNVIEYEPCSVYDSVYRYRLIPRLGFAFGNTEYKNNYITNSESLRDDENGLSGADVAVAGNGYTLGVGVEQNQVFPEIIQQMSGLNVLNTGNAAFGTARELKRVVNTDTSILKYLVIQYSKYDVYENEAYVKGRYSFNINTDSAYKHELVQYRWRKEYFPGKYAMTIGTDFMKSKINRLRKKRYYLFADQPASAKYFLQVLDSYQINDRVKIIVTELNDYNDMDSGFLQAVDSLLQQQEFAHMKNRVRTVDMSRLLTADDYYIIDAHLRPSGHEKIAKEILSVIAANEQSAPQQGEE